ncbi:UDP-N-acetylglucosamine 2-epimerase [Marinobacter vulgaris]|nr:UDP-N-acetylglucosamine 2-epimerase [Marinobacter vulgaris]
MKLLRDRGIPYNFIHSGQHQETISDIISDFQIRSPDYYIANGPDVKSKSQVPKWLYLCAARTGKNSGCWAGRKKGDKDIVLVHGDTLSTLAGALAAKRMGFQCAHIESGLRSFNIFHPFPEELIRLATFRLASVLYCPDASAVANVSSLKKVTINTQGNTMLDATRLAVEVSRRSGFSDFGIVSVHRYENIFNAERFSWLVDTIIRISKRHRLFFIMHPPTEQKLRASGLYSKLEAQPNIELKKRLGYFDFSGLLASAQFLVTDGGSNQEESSYLGLPCLVMRKATERSEGVGQNVVISNYESGTITKFFDNLANYRAEPTLSKNSPTEIIVKHLENFYGNIG